MIKGIIKLGFQKIIDETSTSLWDKYVFDDTWMEYKIQAANYNQQGGASLFTDIIKQNAAAQKLHYLVSVAAVGYIRQLQGVIPGLLNAHGKIIVPFKNFKFNIIESDITNCKLHKVEIIFISGPIICIGFFNSHYLIAAADKQQELNEGKEVETEMIPHSDQLSIYSIIKAAV